MGCDPRESFVMKENAMSQRKRIRPTVGELEILRVLWSNGPATVRDVHETLASHKQTSYNTTLKLLQIMHEKGMVARDTSRRPQIYRTSLPEEQMQKRLVADLLDRAFGGSARKLVAALTAGKISDDELADIRQLLDASEEDKP
jgi:BlaI family penicillinase repressor